MHWWQETEARAHRARTPFDTAHLLWQRFQEAGLNPDLSFLPAQQVAALAQLCCEFVKHTESLLVASDGDAASIKRSLAALDLWSRHAEFWVAQSEKPFARLLDSLDLDPELLDGREPTGGEAHLPPQEQAKTDGRYRHWHLLYERLDLKLSSAVTDQKVARGLARDIAEVYEESLVALRGIVQFEKETRPRFRAASRLLLDLNTAFHFHLGPHHLGHHEITLQGKAAPPLRTWIFLYMASL